MPQGQKKQGQVKVLEVKGDQAYVHYEGCDTRLDCWVHISSLSRLARKESDAGGHLGGEGDGVNKRRKQRNMTEESDSDDEVPSSRRIWNYGAGHGDEHTKVRNVQRIQLGEHVIDAWYYSPYPAPYDKHVDKLYICEQTLQYMKSPVVFQKQQSALKPGPPPGKQVYMDAEKGLCVFCVEGSQERLFCQNLCLLGKLFIEHKTLHYDPSPFYFYLVAEQYEQDQVTRYRPVGYFSKEKSSPDNYNLACILTLPPYQRKGYGKFIISLSYELSRREGKTGSPEKPLSDLGKLSYRSFWSCRLLMVLNEACEKHERPDAMELSQRTGILLEDAISTLQYLGLIKCFLKQYVLAVNPLQVQQLLESFKQRNYSKMFCNPDCFLAES